MIPTVSKAAREVPRGLRRVVMARPCLGALAGAAVLALLSSPACAQSTATATATALVAVPISISTTRNFNFGSIVPGATSGTVVLSTSSGRTVTGGTTLGSGASAACAQLTVTGEGSSTFSVSFSSGTTLALSTDSTKTMAVGTYVLKVGAGSDQTSSYTGTLSSGSATLNIGATLTVGTAAATPTGTYATTNSGGTSLTVTVAYN